MLSTPPAIMMSASPERIAREACTMASAPDPQRRLRVTPGIVWGKPAKRIPMRATLRLSSPAPLLSPAITSSILAGSSPGVRSTKVRKVAAKRSSGRIVESAPRFLPKGVRVALARTAREVLICRIIVDRKGYALFRLDQGDGRVALVREIAEAKGWS